MLKRSPLGITIAVSLLSLAGGCAQKATHAPAQDATAASADIAGAYRHGQFGRQSVALSVCVAHELHNAHPELQFILKADKFETLTAGTSSLEGSNIWAVEFRESGTGGSDVVLRNNGATASDLDEVWRTVESCGKQES